MTLRIEPTRAADIPALQHAERGAASLFAGTGLIGDTSYETAEVTDAAFHLEAISLGLSFSAWIDDKPIGFVIGLVHPDSYYLAELSVDPAYGRRGVGRALVNHFCATAWARGADAVTLSTFRDVPWNAPFYAKLGFVEIPRAAYTDWMRLYEGNQTRNGLDVTKRLFMRLPRPR